MCRICALHLFDLCGDWQEKNYRATQSGRGSQWGICKYINEPSLCAHWQLRHWCYFSKVLAILRKLFWLLEVSAEWLRPHQPPYTNTIATITYNTDCWLSTAASALLAGDAGVAGCPRLPPSPRSVANSAEDTLAFRFCKALKRMWFFTTRPKPGYFETSIFPFTQLCLWEVGQYIIAKLLYRFNFSSEGHQLNIDFLSLVFLLKPIWFEKTTAFKKIEIIKMLFLF